MCHHKCHFLHTPLGQRVLVDSCAMALSTSVSCFAINHHNNTMQHLRNVSDILTTISRFMTPDQETFPVIRKGHRYNTRVLTLWHDNVISTLQKQPYHHNAENSYIADLYSRVFVYLISLSLVWYWQSPLRQEYTVLNEQKQHLSSRLNFQGGLLRINW